MRDGLLRPGEAAEARWQDLSIAQDGSGRLTISIAKERHVLYVSPRTMNALEEMHNTKQAMGIDTEKDDRIFQMGSQQLGRRIRNACSLAGLEGRYGGTSPRTGMAMDLAMTGASVLEIMAAGRWATPNARLRHLLKRSNVTTGVIARLHALHQRPTTPT